jgi:membrane fusion protein, multidrug efflux system
MTQTMESEKLGDKVATSQTPVETVPAPPRTGSGFRIGMIIVVLLLLVAGGIYVYLHYQNRVSSDDANVDGHITAIAPKIPGNVVEVAVLDNQQVKAGQVLVRIDPRDYQAAVDQAKAALLEAESKLHSARVTIPMVNESTESGNNQANAQVADAQAEVARARAAWQQASTSDLAVAEANVRTKQANADRAQADLTRMQPLVEKAEISRQQFDAYTAAARVAAGELQAAEQKLGSARQDVDIRKAALDAAQTKVNQAQAGVENAQANRKQVGIREADAGTAAASVESYRATLAAKELMLSYTTIVSPIDGVVTRKSVEVGQIVQPGQGLMTVIPLQDVWVTANFKETQLADVRPGQKAEVHVDMYGKSIDAHVDTIAAATGSRLSLLPPENATGNFVKVVQRIPVKLLVDNAHGLILRPGMNVDVTIFTK